MRHFGEAANGDVDVYAVRALSASVSAWLDYGGMVDTAVCCVNLTIAMGQVPFDISDSAIFSMVSPRNAQVLRLNISSKRLPRPLAEAAKRFLNRLLGFQQFNAIYSQLPLGQPAEFSRMFLDALPVRVEIAGQPRGTIPATGPLIVVANHPFGLLDGMVLEALLMSVRPDVTVMAVHLFAAIPEYRDRWIFVGPRRNRRRRIHSVRGWRRSFQWLVRGGALVMFPASHVSSFQWRRLSLSDGVWSSHIAAFARRTGTPVLPIHLRGRTGWAPQLAGMVWPRLLDLRAVGSLSSQRGRTLHATIGRLIQPVELSEFATDDAAIAFLRQQTEMLARS